MNYEEAELLPERASFVRAASRLVLVEWSPMLRENSKSLDASWTGGLPEGFFRRMHASAAVS